MFPIAGPFSGTYGLPGDARTRAAHDSLMEIIAHRIVIGDKLEDGRVAAIHIVETHRHRALLSALVCEWSRRRLTFAAEANSHSNPGK